MGIVGLIPPLIMYALWFTRIQYAVSRAFGIPSTILLTYTSIPGTLNSGGTPFAKSCQTLSIPGAKVGFNRLGGFQYWYRSLKSSQVIKGRGVVVGVGATAGTRLSEHGELVHCAGAEIHPAPLGFLIQRFT
jgi:hypothetical protein